MPRGKYPRKKKIEKKNKVPMNTQTAAQVNGEVAEKYIGDQPADYCSMYYKARNEAERAQGKNYKLDAVIVSMTSAFNSFAEAFAAYARISQY